MRKLTKIIIIELRRVDRRKYTFFFDAMMFPRFWKSGVRFLKMRRKNINSFNFAYFRLIRRTLNVNKHVDLD